MAKTTTNPLSNYEKQIIQLENIIRDLETGELPLDEALKQYEQGIKLIRNCQKALNNAEQKIEQLSNNNDGEETLIPFNLTHTQKDTEATQTTQPNNDLEDENIPF